MIVTGSPTPVVVVVAATDDVVVPTPAVVDVAAMVEVDSDPDEHAATSKPSPTTSSNPFGFGDLTARLARLACHHPIGLSVRPASRTREAHQS